MKRMKSVLEEAKFTIQKSHDNIAKYYNQHCISTPVLKHDNKVFFKFMDINTTYSSAKLSHCYLESYIVEK